METIKVKPWGKGQGEFVTINAEDFDPAHHKKFEPKPVAVKAGSAAPPEAPAVQDGAK